MQTNWPSGAKIGRKPRETRKIRNPSNKKKGAWKSVDPTAKRVLAERKMALTASQATGRLMRAIGKGFAHIANAAVEDRRPDASGFFDGLARVAIADASVARLQSAGLLATPDAMVATVAKWCAWAQHAGVRPDLAPLAVGESHYRINTHPADDSAYVLAGERYTSTVLDGGDRIVRTLTDAMRKGHGPRGVVYSRR